MKIPVSLPAEPGVPAFSGELGHINMILGQNGSGKSRLLVKLLGNARNIFGGEFQPVRVEGGRAIQVPVNVGFEHNPSIFGKADQSVKNHLGDGASAALANRIANIFLVLRALEDEAKRKHSDAVVAWQGTDRSLPVPPRPVPPFQRFCTLFSSVFPGIEVVVTSANQLYVKRDGAEYPVQSLSDGERQVFILLADMAILARGRSVFLIDEPELNLHPSLALSLWESIEDIYPDSVFIYATHSLSFALRPSVDAVWCLPHGQVQLTSSDLQNVDLGPFLGAIAGILRSKMCVFVEGNDDSFDRPFYRWLIGRTDVDVIPVGSSAEVIAAACRRSVWKQVTPDVKVVGIVDGDYGRDLSGIDNVVQLPVREVEAFLCDPAVVIAVQQKLSNTDHTLSVDAVAKTLATVAEKNRLRTGAQRVFTEAQIDLAVSIERKTIGSISTSGELRSAIIAEAGREATKATILNSNSIGDLFDRIDTDCSRAIAERNTEAMLRLFDAKRAASEVCKLSGCPTTAGMLKAITTHFTPADFPRTLALCTAVLAALGLDGSADQNATNGSGEH